MSESIYHIIQIPVSQQRSYYNQQEINTYFGNVHKVKDGLKLLAKGILYRLEYTEEDGISPSMDDYTIIATYIGWLIWVGKVEKAKELIRGLMQLSNRISYDGFLSEIQLVHPITAALIHRLYDDDFV
jgi:hypothetical protein